MNQGFVSKQNKGDSEKVFGNMKAPSPKLIDQNDKLKVFDASKDIKGPMQHKAMKPTAPRYKQ